MTGEWTLKPGDKLNGYEIMEPKGKGRFAEVYRAKHRIWDSVALKLFTDAGLNYHALLDEAYTMSAFNNHPHIVAVYDARFIGHFPVLAMEFMAGGTLRGRMQARGSPTEWREAVHIVTQLCYAVRAMHEKRFLHRDIKPENVLFSADGSLAKLGDLGCAVYAADEMASQPSGTVPYMAPEVARGEAHLPQSDIYSLGILLYELVAGSPPFGLLFFEEFQEMVQKGEAIVQWPETVNQQVPQSLIDIVLRATAFPVAKRYPLVGEMLSELLFLQSGEEPTFYSIDGIYAASDNPVETIRDSIAAKAKRLEDEGKWFLDSFETRQAELTQGLDGEMKEVLYSSFVESLTVLHNFYVGLEHIILTLTSRRDSRLRQLLSDRGISPSELGFRIRDQLKGIENVARSRPISPRLEKVLKVARAAHPEGVGERQFLEAALQEKCFATLLLERGMHEI